MYKKLVAWKKNQEQKKKKKFIHNFGFIEVSNKLNFHNVFRLFLVGSTSNAIDCYFALKILLKMLMPKAPAVARLSTLVSQPFISKNQAWPGSGYVFGFQSTKSDQHFCFAATWI